MRDHFANQNDKRRRRWFQLAQPKQFRIGLTGFRENFCIECGFSWEMFEQQSFGDARRLRNTARRRARKTVEGKTTLGRLQNLLPAEIACESEGAHLVCE